MNRIFTSVLCALAIGGCASTSKRNFSIETLKKLPVQQKQIPIKKPKTQRKASIRGKVNPQKVIREANEDAKRNPVLASYQNGAMIYKWEPSSLYQVYTTPLRITDVVFEKGEVIKSITGGDTTRWQVVQSSSGSEFEKIPHIIIKPYDANLNTNLVVMTDRRTYHLEIHSLKSGDYMPSVQWKHPKLRAKPSYLHPFDKTPSQLDFGYHFVAKEKPSWMPLRVFDDGEKTYVEFPKSVMNREMPAFFRLSKSREAEIVNFRTVDNLYIVDGLIDLAELRIGSDERVGIERL